MLGIRWKQLWIVTNKLVHVKAGAIIVTCSKEINKNFVDYAMNSFDKKMFFFKTKYNLSEKLLMKWHISVSMRILI